MYKKKDLIKFDLFYEEVEFVIPKTYTLYALFRKLTNKLRRKI